jgi:putative transposase
MQKEAVTAELQLHSDQGFQYTSTGYFNLTQEYGIISSMSRRVTPKTFFEAQHLIDSYIYFYNHKRIQLKNGLAPLEKRCQL